MRGPWATEKAYVSTTDRDQAGGHLPTWGLSVSPRSASQGPSLELQAVPEVGTGVHSTAFRGLHGLWGRLPHPGFPSVLLKPYLRCPVLSLPV